MPRYRLHHYSVGITFFFYGVIIFIFVPGSYNMYLIVIDYHAMVIRQ